MVERNLEVKNRAGVHARPAALICRVANAFSSKITLFRDGAEVNAKSVIGVISMGAPYGAHLVLQTEGEDEVAAADAVQALFDNLFEED
ncbi:MAG: HPr family phosphocarrier protein [Spirochaetaceae bacterium]|jgi:phosphocarrier protein|nr:HPr family phosphocarrier protein [Spirochaetaceae bacterium]